MGAVDTVVIDMDASVSGAVEDVGTITLDAHDDAHNYVVIDEVARRALRCGGTVLAVRADDVWGGGQLAAILRYQPFST